MPKDFAVLHYLVTHPGQLVTKDELLRAVWAETRVGEAVLKVCMQRIRRALGDKATKPRFIETVHRRGYRFIAPLTTVPPVAGSQSSVVRRQRVGSSEPTLAADNWQLATRFVGREAEVAQLQRWFERARTGVRQLIFVIGEPGIGKTTLVEVFLARVAAEHDPWIARGQCVERYGAGEAYMPVLEALGRLGQVPERTQVISLLRRYAPTWLMQMPALLSASERGKLQRTVLGATQARMLREMAEAVEGLSGERVLILWFEDLQWSDVSTLEWLSVIARRQERARLLVIGTFRPVDVLSNGHPLRAITQELQLHRRCEELRLGFLSQGAIEEYLAQRLTGASQPAASLQVLARMIHQRTEGNPLFMVNVVDHLLAQEALEETAEGWVVSGEVAEIEERVPETLRQMIERQLDHLSSEEQQVLEVASVARTEFSAAAVAAGMEAAVEEVERCCAELARRGHFLQASGTAEWPDGTVATSYQFLHALYQQVLYERIPVSQRIRLHRCIGERKEQGYGEQAGEIAAELAFHFEQGRDYRRAIRYLQQAGENVLRRSANAEAIGHLSRALELLQRLPDTPERVQQEVALQITLAMPLAATKGYAAPEVERAYTRARELCQEVGETPQLFPVLWGLCVFYWVRGELETARGPAEQLLRLAQRVQDPALLLQAHMALGNTLLFLGEFPLARTHTEQGIALYNSQRHSAQTSLYRGPDIGVICLARAAQVLWLLGYPTQALQRSGEALTLAQELSHSWDLTWALEYAALLHQLRGEGQLTRERTEEVIALAREQGFVPALADATVLRGWVLAAQGRGEEGIAQIREGLAAYQALGAKPAWTYYLALLAEAYGKGGRPEEGLHVLNEALGLVHKNGERFYEAELYRLAGELSLRIGAAGTGRSGDKELLSDSPIPRFPVSSPEACFLKAIEIAQRQSAKSLELRASISLARLWQAQGKAKQAHKMLAEIYTWFTEGFDTADLQEAKALLNK